MASGMIRIICLILFNKSIRYMYSRQRYINCHLKHRVLVVAVNHQIIDTKRLRLHRTSRFCVFISPCNSINPIFSRLIWFIFFRFSLKNFVWIKRNLWVTYEGDEKFMQGFDWFNRPLGRTRCRRKYSVIMGFIEIVWQGEYWISLVRDGDKWWTVVNTVTNLHITQNMGECLD